MASVAATGDVTSDRRWTPVHTVAVLVFVPATGAAGVLIPWTAGPAAGWARLVAWLTIFVLLAGLAHAIGHGVTGEPLRGIFIDDRNRVSTARVQLGLWSVLILSGYLEAVLANAALHRNEPLLVSVPQTLWVALGVSTTSFAASPFILKQRTRRGGEMATNPKPADARWRDMVTGEETTSKDMVDIGKLQMVLVTVVLVLAYGIVLGYAFYTGQGKITSLPKVNDAFAILLAVSHGGYLVRKAAPGLADSAKSA